jgi:NADPH:quinone reductase-like Zn-dependent oxidoreductase
MRAIVIHETGGPEVLREEERERPEPGEDEVLVRIRAVSVNPIEWKQRRGVIEKPLPAILGSDISGTVEVSRSDAFSPGAEVFGFAASGAYAEYAVAPARLLAEKPAGISHEQAAALPVAGLTAWQALFDRGRLEPGQAVVIAAAAGGVGHLAVQLANDAGARAIGIGSSANREFVLGLGAAQYVDYTREDAAEVVSGADVAFDAVGGATTAALLPAVRDGGVLVTIANAPPEAEAASRGVRAELLVMRPDADELARIGRLVAEGKLRVEIAAQLPLSEVRRAHELSEAGHTRGKIVLEVA